MTRPRLRVLPAVVACVLAAAPVSVAAASVTHYQDTPGAAIKDCSAGHFPLKGHYTIKVLQEALDRLNASGDQYTNCADVIKATISKLELAAHRKSTGGGSGHPRSTRGTGNGAHSSDIVKKRLQKLTSGGGLPVALPGISQTVTPGTVTDRGASWLSNLPTPLLVVLAALLATVLAVSARAINNLVRDRRPH
ncbi:MAG: hypothetical protein ABSB73_01400 [Solirubrobacteraceae bacterium]|jgi:hypothetical protein